MEDRTAVSKVKNKAPAPIQISAEQLLREASDRIDPHERKKFRPLADLETVDDFRQRNRQFFEDKLRRDRNQMGVWTRYANFEESQQEYARARSVYERALDVDPYNIKIFLKYAEMEMKIKHISMARNIWDRAVTIQPRVDQFWYKYAFMEETLGNIEGVREVYERWMQWAPEESVWLSYIKFERRYKQWSKARLIFERLISLHPTLSAFLAYAKFEEEGRQWDRARLVFERAVTLRDATTSTSINNSNTLHSPKLFVEFAKFEVRLKEYERARVIYKYALNLFSKSEAEGLYHSYSQFERQFGTEESMREVVLLKRRTSYEERLSVDSYDYDAWFDYIKMEEECSNDPAIVRDLYERAIAQVPLSSEKRYWQRYIYLWLYYAVYEEVTMEDDERAKAIYLTALDTIPHEKFTFAKVWIMFAHFLIRTGDLPAARKTLGKAIGMAAKPKIFKEYISLEWELREFDRCRILYQKYIAHDPSNSEPWLSFCQMEQALGEDERVAALFEISISQPLDQPETIWKAYIDWQIEQDQPEKVKSLYERLLERTQHLKVWINYAVWESTVNIEDARLIFERAHSFFRSYPAERLLLLESWLEVEQSQGDDDSVKRVEAMLPRRDDGQLVWPEDAPKEAANKLLEMAHLWKKSNTNNN